MPGKLIGGTGLGIVFVLENWLGYKTFVEFHKTGQEAGVGSEPVGNWVQMHALEPSRERQKQEKINALP